MVVAKKGTKKRNTRQISLKEACNKAQDNRKKKMTWANKRKKEGWVDVDPSAHKWQVKNINTITAGARVAMVQCTASISDIFLTLLPPSVLVEVWKEVGKDWFFYSSVKVPIADAYKMLACAIYLHAEQPTVDKGKLKNVFNEVYKMACNAFNNKGCLGIMKMLQLRWEFKLSPDIAHDKLSKIFCKAVYLGQFVCMDKKQKKWRGWSPHIKESPS